MCDQMLGSQVNLSNFKLASPVANWGLTHRWYGNEILYNWHLCREKMWPRTLSNFVNSSNIFFEIPKITGVFFHEFSLQLAVMALGHSAKNQINQVLSDSPSLQLHASLEQAYYALALIGTGESDNQRLHLGLNFSWTTRNDIGLVRRKFGRNYSCNFSSLFFQSVKTCYKS